MSGQCFPRTAGVVVPLFSLRGTPDAGSGTILDLIPFIEWLARWHQGLLQLLPINEGAPDEASPYTTLSAFAIDPGYITAIELDDVRQSAAAQAWLRVPAVRSRLARGRRTHRRQRRAAYDFQIRLLRFGFEEFEAAVRSGERRDDFDRFCTEQAWWLDEYALFRALKERQQWTDWTLWPADIRDRHGAALAAARAQLQPDSRFAQYMQWVAAAQWQAVRTHARGCGVRLKGDLPFVCGPDSADVWAQRELFDLSSSAGAPPDAFSAEGQQWGLPLYDWGAMRRDGYTWWRRRVRHAAQLYDVVRIDHVVGLFRTYAIPVRAGGTSGFVPPDEHEQWQQGSDLLHAIIESAGPHCAVVAEDLGTVPHWVRELLTQLRIPGYKVFRWETWNGDFIDPRGYPELSVATTGTHDTDTLAEWWDLLGADERAAAFRLLERLDVSLESVELRRVLLQRLYEAGSALTVVPIQDVCGWRERINTPATITSQNWIYRLPSPTGDLDAQPEVYQSMHAAQTMIDATGRWGAPAAV